MSAVFAYQELEKPMHREATAPEHRLRGANDEDLASIVEAFNCAQQGKMSGNDDDTNIFANPNKKDVVRLQIKAKKHQEQHGWMPQKQADNIVAGWKQHAKKQRECPDARSENAGKVVLSFFDTSGSWSQPWVDAGYEVYRFDIQDDPIAGDVTRFSVQFFDELFDQFNGMEIYAILAACPCTDFSSSGARHWAAKDMDGRTISSVELVHQTLRSIEFFRPAIWAIENPVGRIQKLGGLPQWRLSFDPYHLGESYTKKTLIWGRFNADLPIAPVYPKDGSKMHTQYGGKSMATKNARSETPEGFSYGFFIANNAYDHPALALCFTYDRLNSDLLKEALSEGCSVSEIHDAIQDYYYMDGDDEAAHQEIEAMIAQKRTKKGVCSASKSKEWVQGALAF